MIETNDSPLPNGGDYFTNNPNFDPQVFFTDDTNSVLYYLILIVTNDGQYKVVYNGKLNGYINQYRINLSKFIKFTQIKDVQFDKVDDETATQITYREKGPNIILVVDPNNLLVTSPEKFTFNDDGSIYLTESPYLSLPTSAKRNYRFNEKEDEKYMMLGAPNVVYDQSYIPFSLFDFYSTDGDAINILCLDSNLNQTNSMYVERSPFDIRDGLIYVPQNTTRIQVLSDFVELNYIVKPKQCNTQQWYYYNNNGILSTFWSTANIHEVESTEKEYITINNRQINTKNITTKQKKINIGYNLLEAEAYEIAKTPYIWQKVYNSDGSLPMELKRFKNNTFLTFEGWNGSNISDMNIELIIEDEKKYKKITTPQIGFFD